MTTETSAPKPPATEFPPPARETEACGDRDIAAARIGKSLPSDAWDEMVTGGGSMRAPWQRLLGALLALPDGGLAERAERTRLQLRESGVTYNAYDPEGSAERPWALDPVPVIIDAVEWGEIESGVKQRARLLDHILRDLYGDQTLLAEKRYPPALVHANPEFLRPARHALAAHGGTKLHFYAADLVRAPDGIWRVTSDRLQAPTGAGYALENRRILQRTMPEALRSLSPRPIRPFFERWQSNLQGLSPTDNPRIVLLTPGPLNEAYFEHVYLARELGATLVEGADLTVRSNCVYLKSLDGLKRVDVIIRRIDGSFSDPLELRADSALGIVGLMEAIRAGTVAVVNMPGAGLLETPALMAFLPRLAQHLLGEDLALPSLATWWCGQPYALEAVQKRFDDLAIQTVFADGVPVTLAASLSADAKRQMLEQIACHPAGFAAQERIIASTAPGIAGNGLTPQSVVLRAFCVADGDDYMVMPGGLARVIPEGGPLLGGIQRGGISKDVWITTNDPAPIVVSARPTQRQIKVQRGGGEVQSRVADNLFWFGRYAERLENTARLLRAATTRLIGTLTARELIELSALAGILGTSSVISMQAASAPADSAMLHGAIVKASSYGGPVEGLLRDVQRLAASIRDRLSLDMWKAVGHLTEESRSAIVRLGGEAGRSLEALDSIVRLSAAVAGLASENMTRGLGWRFLELGRRIERGIYTARSVRGALLSSPNRQDIGLKLALELCDSAITYRTRYLAAIMPAPALDLVLADEGNPRSLAYQSIMVCLSLDALPSPDGRKLTYQGEQAIAGMETLIAAMGQRADASATLGEELLGFELGLFTLSDDIKRAYFSHVIPQVSYGMGSA